MSGDFDATGGTAAPTAAAGDVRRRMVPMKVGSATVFIEAADDGAAVEPSDEFYAVGATPADAFAVASDALKECVKVVGERIEGLGGRLKPEEVGVEFTITFDVEGKATIIPVLLTGKARTAMGVKVTATWKPREQS